MKRVLVTGGTGHLGQYVIDCLLKKNFDISVLSSRANILLNHNVALFKGDLANNVGLIPATAEADMVIHCASDSSDFERVDINGTRNLLGSINRKRTQKFVYISIVGVDKSNFPYYRAKYDVEKMIAGNGISYTILRTTQFHRFVLNMIRSFVNDTPRGVIRIPSGMRFQPVDTREVAQKLVHCLDESSGLVDQFGGPEVLAFEEMAQNYLDITETKTLFEPLNIAGERFDLFRSGINLCPENAFGKISWKNFLQDNFSRKKTKNTSR
jgi:uncharacterized protein YbjT (DUF2867 family)